MRYVFITGAASGIGLATAKLFAQRGWFVGLYDINQEGLKAAINEAVFNNACHGLIDVTDRDSVAGALQHFSKHSDGNMHLLVNNAGVLTAGDFSKIDANLHDKMIDINVKGLTNVAHGSFEYLKQTPRSAVVNLCSASSIFGIPQLAVYSASKFYVNGLTQALNIEWAKHDIRVTCVKPPLVNTGMGQEVHSVLGTKMAVDLEPHDVSLAIYDAVYGRKLGYVLTINGKLWAAVDKILPDLARRRLTSWLTDA